MFTGPPGQEQEGSVEPDAAPGFRPLKHPNAGSVTPLWLGDGCEGLSGLYAAVNGIRLALAHEHRFTAAEVHFLMRAGLRFLDGRLTPQQCVLNGLRLQLWRGLVEGLVEATRQRTGLRLAAERIHVDGQASRSAAFEALDGALRTFRVPLILSRNGHYTVVSGTTAASVLLFDSRGGCWIGKRVCGVPGDSAALRHRIYPASFIALSA